MARQLRASTALTATPYEQRDQAVNGTDLVSAYSYEVVKLHYSPGGHRPCLHTSCGTVAKPILASLVAVILLIYLCSFARTGTERLRDSSRKLSDDEAASRRESGVCGETGEETDTSSSSDEEPLVLPPPEVSEPSLARAQKRAFGERERDERHAGPSRLSLPLKKRRPFPATSLVAAEGVQEAQLPPFLPGPSEPSAWQEPPAILGESTFASSADASYPTSPRGRPSEEMLAANALLLLLQTPLTGEGSGQETGQEVEEEPQPSTSRAGIPAFPSETVFPGEQPGGIHEAHDGRQPAPGTGDQEAQLQRIAAAAARTGSGAAPFPGRPGSPLVPPNHVFFRLPSLQTGVAVRPFNLERAHSYAIATSRPNKVLQEVRALFAKESLCQEDACRLADLIEQLAAHCVYYQTGEVNQLNLTNAGDMLGQRFLLFDAIVSFFQVAGCRPPELWWMRFTGSVPHTLEGWALGRKRKPPPALYRDLALSLSNALAVLKTGVRPSDDILYKIKFRLFCSEKTLRRFRRRDYDAWRADCFERGGST